MMQDVMMTTSLDAPKKGLDKFMADNDIHGYLDDYNMVPPHSEVV